MLDREKLRKADVFSGAVVFLFGLWIVSQAFGMPMKDSWGGVMNVWYVSPALLPLFIGFMIMLLGAMLVRVALKTIGFAEFKNTLRWFSSPDLIRVLTSDSTTRFYAIAVLFLTLVFLHLPRIDFFLCAVLFLAAFITMFHFNDDRLLKKLFFFYLAGEAGFIIYFALGIDGVLSRVLPYAEDLLTLCFIAGYCMYARLLVRETQTLRRPYRTAMIVAVATPLVIGSIFKYFLMVPMPKEGLVTAFLDFIWYFEL